MVRLGPGHLFRSYADRLLLPLSQGPDVRDPGVGCGPASDPSGRVGRSGELFDTVALSASQFS